MAATLFDALPMHHATLRTLLRPAASVVSVTRRDTLRDAFGLMRAHGYSQLPVVEGEQVLGIVDESDVLLHVYAEPERFAEPVEHAMARKLDVLDIDAPVDALLPLFQRGHIAVVAEAGRFAGLVTRSDLLEWLAR